ncbi:MAG: 16S rRNA (guanine(527)-N(7))-methyltransferase RsmG [bacterium]
MDKRFNLYLQELVSWNEKFNLTAITKPEEIKEKHFSDSLLLLQALPTLQTNKSTDYSLIDIGTGAGFPGIPLKLACPGLKLTLLDSNKKKVEFLDHMIRLLGLTETQAIWGRAEDFAKENRESFDLAASRAVADLAVLSELSLPLVKVGGVFVAYKEVAIEPELVKASEAIKLLGGKLREVKKFPARSLVIIDKVSPTPVKFPRRVGMAKKRPL